ncbi:PREDICTED: proline-rich protein 15 isoform X1 [Myotis brandtii]|nr:PREDICTED: proline-rich protein 15 isoform X1 [Myotis brandtii]
MHFLKPGRRKSRRPLPLIPPRSPAASSGRRSGVDAGDHRERGTPAAEAFPKRGAPDPRPAMADSGGTGSSGPWWKSLVNSRKKSKEASVGVPPPAQSAPGEPAPPSPDWTNSSQENQHPNLLASAGEPHKPDKLCADKAGNSRRNLKISRSGRFKEKRKVRATLLPEGVRALEEADCPGDPQEDQP